MLLVTRELVERSVANYIEAQIEHSSSEQDKARRVAREEKPKEARRKARHVDREEKPDEDAAADDDEPDDESHRSVLPVRDSELPERPVEAHQQLPVGGRGGLVREQRCEDLRRRLGRRVRRDPRLLPSR